MSSPVTSQLDQIHCENCNKDITDDVYRYDNDLCLSCFENTYCECGNRLEDSYGSPGDGFCICCR